MQNKSHGMMFHHFHNQLHIKGQGSISGEKFYEMLTYYKKKYNLISADEYFDKSQKEKLGDRDVCITFDDGLKCQYDIAYPVLKSIGASGISAFFFVYSSPLIGGLEFLEIYRHFRFLCFEDINDFYDSFFITAKEHENQMKIDMEKAINGFEASDYFKQYYFYTHEDRKFRYIRNEVLKTSDYDFIMDKMMVKHGYSIQDNKNKLWMTAEDVKDLRNSGHIIGLHSHTHPTRLEKFTYNEQMEEYSQNRDILQDILKEKIITASYPCDSYDANTLEIMNRLDIRLGFKANMLNEPASAYEIPRQDHANILKEM